MKPRIALAAAGLVAAAAAASAADQNPAGCAGIIPPYKNICAFPITVYSKPQNGALHTYQLAPGQAAPDERSPQERNGGVMTVNCRQGETAYSWSGGAHNDTPWTGMGGYECRK